LPGAELLPAAAELLPAAEVLFPPAAAVALDPDGQMCMFVCTGRVPDLTSLFLPTSFCM
jgi:hypothetical protein